MEKTRKRRSPFKSEPRGKGRHGEHVSGTANQLAVLDLLNTYRYLNSDYIRAWLPGGSTNDVILLLSQEGYIRVPRQVPKIFGRKLIYEIVRGDHHERATKAEQLMAANDRVLRDRTSDSQFAHEYLISSCQFSFDIAPREIPGLKKRTLDDIKAHENYPGGVDPDHIRPDAPLFGYEYTRPDGRKRYFYLHGFEADRGTEPLRGDGRQTIERKVRHYAEYLRARVYNDVYGISNLSVAFITMSEARAHNILDIVRQVAGDCADKFLVKYLPNFIRDGNPPPPTGHLVAEPWLTTTGTRSILEVLTRPDHSRASKPAPPTQHLVSEPWVSTTGTLSLLEVLKHERTTHD
jgi:hypothetical protein